MMNAKNPRIPQPISRNRFSIHPSIAASFYFLLGLAFSLVPLVGVSLMVSLLAYSLALTGYLAGLFSLPKIYRHEVVRASMIPLRIIGFLILIPFGAALCAIYTIIEATDRLPPTELAAKPIASVLAKCINLADRAKAQELYLELKDSIGEGFDVLRDQIPYHDKLGTLCAVLVQLPFDIAVHVATWNALKTLVTTSFLAGALGCVKGCQSWQNDRDAPHQQNAS